MATRKFPGCKEKETVERNYSIEIPLIDTDSAPKPGISPLEEEWPILKTISNSIQGKLFQIEYSLKCFVKHDSWDAFGEGNCVEIPIKISTRI